MPHADGGGSLDGSSPHNAVSQAIGHVGANQVEDSIVVQGSPGGTARADAPVLTAIHSLHGALHGFGAFPGWPGTVTQSQSDGGPVHFQEAMAVRSYAQVSNIAHYSLKAPFPVQALLPWAVSASRGRRSVCMLVS